MGIINSNKEISKKNINCGDEFKIKLSVCASPDIVSSPADIVLALDRSSSMNGNAMNNLKSGVNKLIDIIDKNSDGKADGKIGGGSRMGIVSFSSSATADMELTTSVQNLKSAVNSLSCAGLTNHCDAFLKSGEMLEAKSNNEKILIMFTDGITTAGEPPLNMTNALKEKGIVIYCIGMINGENAPDIDALKVWSSDPDSSFVHTVPGICSIEDIFEDLAKNITKAGTTGASILETVSPCFEIVKTDSVSQGSCTLISSGTLRWDIGDLGVKKTEGATAEFTVRHLGECTGCVNVNADILFTDKEENVVNFPNPQINIKHDETVISEDCPIPYEITILGCKDSLEYDAGDISVDGTGRILVLSTTLKNICPHKRVALAVTVNELDLDGAEHKRGMKTMVVPAHEKEGCADIKIKCIKFILPESEDVTGSPHSLCNERRFNVRFMAHYIDNDFDCCH